MLRFEKLVYEEESQEKSLKSRQICPSERNGRS
jgi:hypothetical protein